MHTPVDYQKQVSIHGSTDVAYGDIEHKHNKPYECYLRGIDVCINHIDLLKGRIDKSVCDILIRILEKDKKRCDMFNKGYRRIISHILL